MEEIRIGVYICWCGTNISRMVDVEDVARELSEMPGVVIAKDYKYMCSDPGQALIIKDIKEHKLNRVVVSACSPRIHELTFRKALENAGLNPYMFQMANIREQVSWVHDDRVKATKKAKALVAAAINRVKWHESLDKRTVSINPATLVIGGGIAGITAALELADTGSPVYLIEKEAELGGNMAKIDLTFPYLNSAKQIIQEKIERTEHHPNIQVFKNTVMDEIFGYIGNFNSTIGQNGSQTDIKFGNIVVATGLKPFDPSGIENYGYGKFPDVITSLEFEQKLLSGNILTNEGKDPENVVIIHCVGSRNQNEHEYCSRTCCMTALKYANQVRSSIPKANIYQVYADMRAFGNACEELYTSTSRKGIMFLMFDQQNDLPVIREADVGDSCKMVIEMNEKLSGERIEIPADLVILMVGLEAHEDAKKVSHTVGISMDSNSFFMEKHPKLDPVATTTSGVYVVGNCQAPKDIPDTITQAKAATARIMGTIKQGEVEVEVITAVVNEDICCGCQTCIQVCPYTAITYDVVKGVSVVNEAICKGCGTCGSACPTGAIRSRHFTDNQILSQIKGLLSKSLELKEV